MPPVNSMDSSPKALESRLAVLEKALQISAGSSQIVLIAGRSKITISDSGIILETAGTIEIDARNINLDGLANIQLTAGMNTSVTSGANVQMTCGAGAVISTKTDTDIIAGRNLNLSASSATLTTDTNTQITAGNDFNTSAGRNTAVTSGGNMDIRAGGNLTMKASRIVQN
jgi:uncharacterized protein (DUF2345 family)